jgi:uncharacterized membrane protein
VTNEIERQAAPPPVVDDNGFALAVYILYLLGFLTGITVIVGVIIAHVKESTATGIARSHFQFQIRTFWIGLLYLITGTVLLYFIIGIPILLWWAVWTLVRVIKGLILLNDRRPVPEPTSWLFG